MMRWKPLWCACAVIGLLVSAAESAEQLAKHGSYAGKLVWFEKGTIMPVEKDYFFKEAPQQGLFLNAAGGGFLHSAVFTCGSQGVVQNDQFSFSGYCIATDKEGDKAVLKWACARGGDRCVGAFDWVGGTGKYAGIRGHSQFDGGQIAEGPLGAIGDSNFKGEWNLP